LIKNLSRYALVTAFALFLSGCITRTGQSPAPVEEAKPGTEQPAQPPMRNLHIGVFGKLRRQALAG
jgi:PBP1b-binding outer membrane lipoprotein LpoB